MIYLLAAILVTMVIVGTFVVRVGVDIVEALGRIELNTQGTEFSEQVHVPSVDTIPQNKPVTEFTVFNSANKK